MSNINEFKSRLKGGGARANQFRVICAFPGYAEVGGETSDLSFLCKATSLPGQDIPVVTVDFRGRQLKIAGDSREFADWNMTIINDTSFEIRNAFERWMNGMNNMTDNEGLTNPLEYQRDVQVQQLDRDSNVIKSYSLRGAFPVKLGDIALAYGTNDTIEDFTVDMSYQYFETDTTT